MTPAARKTSCLALAALFALGAACEAADGGAGSDGACRLRFYGTYSLGKKHASSFHERVAELRALGGNFVVALGSSRRDLDALPPGVLAAPGCSLLKRPEWKNEEATRRRLEKLSADFATHPRVWGICLAHEVNEFTDHARRVRMYRLAKSFFPGKRVFFYYGRVPGDYGRGGEVESDVLFTSLNPFWAKTGEYDRDKLAVKLERALAAVDRTPGIPLWGQTSINADHKYVTAPETMVRTWGPTGENMLVHVQDLFSRRSAKGTVVSGLFWRSLGRFDWDLGHPRFAAHRERVREIARRWRCPSSAVGG